MTRLWPTLGMLFILAIASQAQQGKTTAPATPATSNDRELAEKVHIARRDYQKSLETLRQHYSNGGDREKLKWVEEELRQYHRIPKQPFVLDLDVPNPTFATQVNLVNVPDANNLLDRALQYKDRGFGTDLIDNQRRAEILLQEILTKYPNSNKISEAAYWLGDIYEHKPYVQYQRSALYFERCSQWNPHTSRDARLRAARIYDRNLQNRTKAVELYREVTTHEYDPKQKQEATRRIAELTGTR